MDKATFILLVDQKSETLYRVARTILRNDEDCKDALQETALKAWENRQRLRDETLFGTWITRICINVCHTIGRKKRKYDLQQDICSTSEYPAPDPSLQLTLENLPEKLRLPLVLHYLEGYSYQDISTMLHIPQTTVRSRLSRAREQFRKSLHTDKEA
jgi:RNA polymerase sigma-70 factor, ECF subfamily